MPLSNEFKDLAETLAAKQQEGTTARVAVTSAQAFGWATGTAPTVSRFTESVRVDGLRYDYVRVGATATPAKKVAEGTPKPTAVQLTNGSLTIPKWSGLAEFSLERALSTTALLPALSATIAGQALVAYDVDCIAALIADKGSTATGASWTEAILNGVAEVASAGMNPDLLILAPADYASAVQDPGSAFSSDPANGIVSLFGLTIGVCVGAATGQSFVMDSRAAIAVENVSSPLVLLDCVSKAELNIARLVADLVAGFIVTQPAGVCQITVTAAASRGGGRAGATKSDYDLGA